MKKLIAVLAVVGILWALYTAGMAGYAYITISNLVDEVVPRQIGTVAVDRYDAQERNERIKSAVAKTLTHAGLAVEPAAIAVDEDGSRLAVRVAYDHPVITYQGETKVAIPVTVTSSYPVPPRRN
jgi:hypothetical protein